jgi:hypothetical protein
MRIPTMTAVPGHGWTAICEYDTALCLGRA